MTGEKFTFSNIEELRRNREIEGTIGIHIKYTDEIFLHVLAISDANPRWNDKAKKAFDEINRLNNIGAAEETVNRRFSQLLTETVVLGWHGPVDDEDETKFLPGGPRDAEGNFVPFTPEACIAFLTQADDVVTDLLSRCRNTQNFRIGRVKAIAEQIKNA